MDPLVTTDWLAAHRGDVVVLDASYTSTLPGETPRPARAGFEREHVPGARFLDLDTLVDASNPLPSTVPPATLVAKRLGELGIGNDTPVVLYDDGPHHTSARAWWLLTSFGARQVAILDGGLAAWREEGRPLDTGAADLAVPATFDATLDADRLATLHQVTAIVATDDAQILDARSPSRFNGEEPDPRPGVAPGHIPGAANLRYSALFDADGRWKRGDALAAAFADAGVDWTRSLVTTCGSGITAAVLSFGAHMLGHASALYDGSWSEWGADPATPKATGA